MLKVFGRYKKSVLNGLKFQFWKEYFLENREMQSLPDVEEV